MATKRAAHSIPVDNFQSEQNSLRRVSEEKRQKEAASYNKRTKYQPFEAGDQIWECEEARNKLKPKWSRASGDPGTTYRCKRKEVRTQLRAA